MPIKDLVFFSLAGPLPSWSLAVVHKLERMLWVSTLVQPDILARLGCYLGHESPSLVVINTSVSSPADFRWELTLAPLLSLTRLLSKYPRGILVLHLLTGSIKTASLRQTRGAAPTRKGGANNVSNVALKHKLTVQCSQNISGEFLGRQNKSSKRSSNKER